jgi:hypothetical protein
MQVVVLAGERSFRALLARDLELQRGQLLLPLGIGLMYFPRLEWDPDFVRSR